MNDSEQQLLLQHLNLGTRVLAAWFDDAKFRAAWAPQTDLFVADWQRAIAAICAARGATLSRDDLILQLDRQGNLKLFENGADGAFEALVGVGVELNPWSAVDRLREVAGARLLMDRLVAIRSELARGDGLGAAREGLATALRDADFASGAKARTVRESLTVAYEHATKRERVRGARTISKRLNATTGGVQKGSVWLLAAGTSWGKSSFIVGTANRVLRDGQRPLVVTVEDPERLFGARLLLARTGVNALRLRQASLRPDEHQLVVNELQAAEDVPWFLSAVGRSAESIAADIRSLVVTHGIDLVMVDYVQRMRLAARSQDKRNEINAIGYMLTDAIKESGAGGILFSQLTEDSSSGKLRARESEDLHNSAEVVLFGKSERSAKLDASGKKQGDVNARKLWVDKVKEGPAKFEIDLDWDSDAARFVSDYAAEDQQQALGIGHPPVDPTYDHLDEEHVA